MKLQSTLYNSYPYCIQGMYYRSYLIYVYLIYF